MAMSRFWPIQAKYTMVLWNINFQNQSALSKPLESKKQEILIIQENYCDFSGNLWKMKGMRESHYKTGLDRLDGLQAYGVGI